MIVIMNEVLGPVRAKVGASWASASTAPVPSSGTVVVVVVVVTVFATAPATTEVLSQGSLLALISTASVNPSPSVSAVAGL